MLLMCLNCTTHGVCETGSAQSIVRQTSTVRGGLGVLRGDGVSELGVSEGRGEEVRRRGAAVEAHQAARRAWPCAPGRHSTPPHDPLLSVVQQHPSATSGQGKDIPWKGWEGIGRDDKVKKE